MDGKARAQDTFSEMSSVQVLSANWRGQRAPGHFFPQPCVEF